MYPTSNQKGASALNKLTMSYFAKAGGGLSSICFTSACGYKRKMPSSLAKAIVRAGYEPPRVTILPLGHSRNVRQNGTYVALTMIGVVNVIACDMISPARSNAC